MPDMVSAFMSKRSEVDAVVLLVSQVFRISELEIEKRGQNDDQSKRETRDR